MSGSPPSSASTSVHQLVVGDLLVKHPGSRTRGFKRSVTESLDGQLELPWLRIVPDLYEVSPGLVIAYEVEDTHRVDRSKLRAYARLWAALDELDWELRLVIVDIRGGRLEPNLAEVYYHQPG